MNKIILITIFPFLLLEACKHQTKEEKPEKFTLTDTMMRQIGLTKAGEQQVTSELKLFGKIAADNAKQAQVFPVVGGNVLKVNVELGDAVQKGQVLAVIRSGEVAEYERQLMEANNNVSIQEKNLQVAKDMYSGKLATEKEMVMAQNELQNAKASLQRIKEVFHIYNLGKDATYNVVAPISGFIIDKNITENMQLRSDRTENIFSIAQIDVVSVMANVNESEIGKISQGIDAEIHVISYPDRVFRGKVDKIFNVLDDNTKAMKIRISIQNDDLALKPEMSATVNLKIQEDKRLIAIPSSAVIFDKSKNWVMVYKGRSDIETRRIEVYSQSGSITYVSSGLQEGETVISKDQLLIYDALND